MTRSPVAIEVFCGCGGMSTGFLDAGIRVAAGFDIDRRSIEAYDYNHAHRGSRGFVRDLTQTDAGDLLRDVGLKRVDVLIGGPPCQPFSIVGKREGSLDARARLVFDFIRLVRDLKPRALFFENVPNLGVIEDGWLLRRLVRALERLGYSIACDIAPAADFGVAQVRRRLLLIGIRGTRVPQLPVRTHGPDGMKPYATAREALADLPDAGEFGECGVFNHEPTMHSSQMIVRLAKLRVGEREKGSFHDRLHPDRPSYTLRAGSGNFSPLRPIHYRYNRVITVRESARLQSFADDFIWPDWIPRLQQYRQVGNAVPPLVAAAVARSLAEQCSWNLEPDLFRGRPEDRAPATTMTDAERLSERVKRIRGASLGRTARRA